MEIQKIKQKKNKGFDYAIENVRIKHGGLR
jgi:hypothetical protein